MTGAFATWLLEQVADAGRSRLFAFLLGTEQERALRSAAADAIRSTAERFGSADAARMGELARVIDQVFAARVPASIGQQTLLQTLHGGIAAQLAPLDDAELTGTGRSSAELLGVSAAELTEELTGFLVQEIMSRGARGGALTPLANQLGHDLTHLQGLRIEAKLEQLVRVIEVRTQPARRQVGLLGQTRMHDRFGRIRRVRDCTDADALALGVNPAIHYEDYSPVDILPAYVRRDAEVQGEGGEAGSLASAFTRGGIVILEGDSASGKTRTAFEAMRELSPDRRLIVPDNPMSLRELKNDGIRLSDAIVWLDDIDTYIAAGGLDAAVLDALCPPESMDVLMLATLRSQARNLLEEARDLDRQATPVSRAARDIFSRARIVLLDRGLTHTEIRRAEALRTTDPRIGAALDQETGAGFAEYMAAAPATLQRWESARRGQNPTAGAIISAAVGARLVGLRKPLTKALLESLHIYYLSPREVNNLDRAGFTESLGWAMQTVQGASSCIVPEGGDTYRTFDYLVDHVQATAHQEVLRAFQQSNVANDPPLGLYSIAATIATIPTEAWSLLLPLLEPADLEMHGLVTNTAGLHQISESVYWQLSSIGTSVLYLEEGARPEDWLKRTAEAGHSVAMFNLALQRYKDNDLQGAEKWYRRAADQGHTDAMNNLAVLHYLADDLQGAEQWYRRAADQGHTDAMNNLAVLLYEGGRAEEAKEWWQRASEKGDEAASHNVRELQDATAQELTTAWYKRGPETWNIKYKAMIFRGQINITQPDVAERLWLNAAEGGDVAAMVKLSTVYNNTGDLGQARRWLQRAAEASDVDAMRYLGFKAFEQGDGIEATKWWKRAADAGDVASMINLSSSLHGTGQEEAERQWAQKAAAFGHTAGMMKLFVMYRGAGDEAQSAKWFRRAADAGNTDVMVDLAAHQLNAGNSKEAEAWLWRAANVGHARATLHLAALLYSTDRREEARLRAMQVERGDFGPEDTNELLLLGDLLSETGQEADATKAWQRAAKGGNTKAMRKLAATLIGAGNSEEAQAWLQRAAEAKDPAAMIELCVVLSQEGRSAQAEQWLRRAAEAGNPTAMVAFGLSSQSSGHNDEAESWYRQAAEAGDTQAMFRLGNLLQGMGRNESAQEWWRRAVNDGHVESMVNLGVVLYSAGRMEEAQLLWSRAAETGDSGAMCNLGFLYQDVGDSVEAERWWRLAANNGKTEAMAQLAEFLREAGRLEEAEQWHRRATGAEAP